MRTKSARLLYLGLTQKAAARQLRMSERTFGRKLHSEEVNRGLRELAGILCDTLGIGLEEYQEAEKIDEENKECPP